MFCSNCGKELPDGIKFCPECGQQVGTIPQQQPQTVIVKMPRQPKSKIIAIILLILFGFLGLHKFYLKKEFEGTMFLLCGLIGLFMSLNGISFISMIVGIALLFDLILIAFSEDDCFLTDEEINQKKQQKAIEEQKVRDYYNKRREELKEKKES